LAWERLGQRRGPELDEWEELRRCGVAEVWVALEDPPPDVLVHAEDLPVASASEFGSFVGAWRKLEEGHER
jgi:hypothetical protein